MSESSGAGLVVARGVYDAHRATALAGVPQTTLHYWARSGFYRPSITPEPRVRLWSWDDLLALRAIDWLRRTKGPNQPRRVAIPKIRTAMAELERMGISPERLHEVVLVSHGGQLFASVGDDAVRAEPGHQRAWSEVLELVRPYGTGPDLLTPRPLLRILPGKLHGEPHLLGTRIPSAAIYSLHINGYPLDTIQEMYPEAAQEALAQAIDLEASLARRAA